MRKIIQRHMLIDQDENGWEAIITVPWPESELSHGPDTVLVTLSTPDDPEHWAYGEDGPTFDVSYLKTLVALAEQEVRL